jgi:uncharacterized protein
MQIKTLLILLITLLLVNGCGENPSPEQQEYIDIIEKNREQKDEYMEKDPSSPFSQDPAAKFSQLKYYDVNLNFLFKSRLFEYPQKDTVIVFGTKGEERKVVRFGYVTFPYEGKEYNINVYKGTSRQGMEYFSIWFTDETTGEETYGVGRYIDFEYNQDTSHIYLIDFNLAYNPYCAYSAKFSCAIPTKEDHIAMKIKAGEKNFH